MLLWLWNVTEELKEYDILYSQCIFLYLLFYHSFSLLNLSVFDAMSQTANLCHRLAFTVTAASARNSSLLAPLHEAYSFQQPCTCGQRMFAVDKKKLSFMLSLRSSSWVLYVHYCRALLRDWLFVCFLLHLCFSWFLDFAYQSPTRFRVLILFLPVDFVPFP